MNKRKNMIRKANNNDIEKLIDLLLQDDMVHFKIRPDLFKPNTTKYNAQELCELLKDENKPIFVYDDNGVLGYVFCQISRTQNAQLFHDIKTLYIDDICVDENARGRHVGKALFDYVKNYAQSIGCHNVTLNVWSGNDTALSFYQNMGMTVQKTTMELVF